MNIWRGISFVIFFDCNYGTGKCANTELLPLDIVDVRFLLANRSALFVDKTEYALKLLWIKDRKNFLLVRPRKFGKTTFLRTLELICEGEQSKVLFENKTICERGVDYDWKRYKVARFDFSDIGSSEMGQFERNLQSTLRTMSANVPAEADIEYQVPALIRALSGQENEAEVVVLIDEYDSPITNVLLDYDLSEQVRHQVANANREVMKRFFTALQEVKDRLRLVFVTGVVKYAPSSVFAEENQFYDLSMDPEFAAIVGFTRGELYSYYDDYIRGIANNQSVKEQDIRKELAEFYEGYMFAPEASVEYVYNPYAILKCLENKGEMRDYWYESASPKFLYNEMQKAERQNGPVFGETKVHRTQLAGIEAVNDTSLHAVMYHQGYYTIKKYDPENEKYVLKVPNAGIRDSFRRDLRERQILFKSQAPIYVRVWDCLDELTAENAEENVARLVDLIDLHCTNEPGFRSMRRPDFREMLQYIFMEAGLFNIVDQYNVSSDLSADVKVETYNTVALIRVEKNRSNADLIKRTEVCEELCTRNKRRCCLLIALNFSPAEADTYLPVKNYQWRLYNRLAAQGSFLPEYNVTNRTWELKNVDKPSWIRLTKASQKSSNRSRRTGKSNKMKRPSGNRTSKRPDNRSFKSRKGRKSSATQ